MALQRPDPGPFDKIFGVNGLPYHDYSRFQQYLDPGQKVALQRQPNNAKDSNAIAVLFQGYQVGWIPRADNTMLAHRMDAGQKFEARVETHEPGSLRIRVKSLEAKGPPAPPKFTIESAFGDDQPTNFHIPTTEKDTTMSISSAVTTTIEKNKSAAGQAAYLEAGRIANKQLTKVAAKTLPLMARGYADTPLGRLLLANAATVAAAQLRPNDATLKRLTEAMTVSAYQEVIQTFDLDGMLDNLLQTPDLQRAISKLNADKE